MKFIFVGGGAFNKTIVVKIYSNGSRKGFQANSYCKNYRGFKLFSKKVEAGLFAWLAMSKICNTKLDYRNVTGCNQTSVLGKVFY